MCFAQIYEMLAPGLKSKKNIAVPIHILQKHDEMS
jgi:hypothetical protein